MQTACSAVDCILKILYSFSSLAYIVDLTWGYLKPELCKADKPGYPQTVGVKSEHHSQT